MFPELWLCDLDIPDDCKASDPESIHCDLDHLPSQTDFVAQKVIITIIIIVPLLLS